MDELSINDRLNLLKKFNEKRPISDKVDFMKIAEIIEDFSEEDIKKLCDDAASVAWKEAITIGKERDISMHDFEFFSFLNSKKTEYYKKKLAEENDKIELFNYLCFIHLFEKGLSEGKTLYLSLWNSVKFEPNGLLGNVVTEAAKKILKNENLSTALTSSITSTTPEIYQKKINELADKMDQEGNIPTVLKNELNNLLNEIQIPEKDIKFISFIIDLKQANERFL